MTTSAPAAVTEGRIDHRKQCGPLYRARRTPGLVDVPPLQYLMIDGHGDPNLAPEYTEALQALYAVAYGVRFAVRRSGGEDFTVMPLQGLWSAADSSAFVRGDRASWDWTMMIMQPDAVTAGLVDRVRTAASAKAPARALAAIRLERYEEGPAAQVLHVGPYAGEGPTIEALHGFIAASGLHRRGRHHEIYLGDPRRATPERLRTIIRQPVGPAAR
jgi:hypothetical protein